MLSHLHLALLRANEIESPELEKPKTQLLDAAARKVAEAYNKRLTERYVYLSEEQWKVFAAEFSTRADKGQNVYIANIAYIEKWFNVAKNSFLRGHSETKHMIEDTIQMLSWLYRIATSKDKPYYKEVFLYLMPWINVFAAAFYVRADRNTAFGVDKNPQIEAAFTYLSQLYTTFIKCVKTTMYESGSEVKIRLQLEKELDNASDGGEIDALAVNLVLKDFFSTEKRQYELTLREDKKYKAAQESMAAMAKELEELRKKYESKNDEFLVEKKELDNAQGRIAQLEQKISDQLASMSTLLKNYTEISRNRGLKKFVIPNDIKKGIEGFSQFFPVPDDQRLQSVNPTTNSMNYGFTKSVEGYLHSKMYPTDVNYRF